MHGATERANAVRYATASRDNILGEFAFSSNYCLCELATSDVLVSQRGSASRRDDGGDQFCILIARILRYVCVLFERNWNLLRVSRGFEKNLSTLFTAYRNKNSILEWILACVCLYARPPFMYISRARKCTREIHAGTRCILKENYRQFRCGDDALNSPGVKSNAVFPCSVSRDT